MKKILIAVTLVIMIGLVFPTQALAAGLPDGKVVFGDDFVLESGETLDGDLMVLGGNVTLEEDSQVNGNVSVLGGNIYCDGKVQGDLAVLGGNVSLQSHAVIYGDVLDFGGDLSIDPEAVVKGEQVSGRAIGIPWDFHFNLDRPFVKPFRSFTYFASPFIKLLWLGFRTFMMAALAVLVVMLWPKPARRVAEAVVEQPWIAGGVGLLTLIVAPPLCIFFAITIILLPVSIIEVLALAAAVVFGWIAIGLEIGDRLAEMFKWDLHPAAAAGFGALVLGLVAGGIGFIDCIGWIVPFLVIILGIGGVILTLFGSRPYTFAAAKAVVEPEQLPVQAEEKKPKEITRKSSNKAKSTSKKGSSTKKK